MGIRMTRKRLNSQVIGGKRKKKKKKKNKQKIGETKSRNNKINEKITKGREVS